MKNTKKKATLLLTLATLSIFALWACSKPSMDDLPYYKINWKVLQSKKDKEIKKEEVFEKLPQLNLSQISETEGMTNTSLKVEKLEEFLKSDDLYEKGVASRDTFTRLLSGTLGNEVNQFFSDEAWGLIEEIYSEEHQEIKNISFISYGNELNEELFTSEINMEVNVVNDSSKYLIFPIKALFKDNIGTQFIVGNEKTAEFLSNSLSENSFILEGVNGEFLTKFNQFASPLKGNFSERDQKKVIAKWVKSNEGIMSLELAEELYELSSGDLSFGSFTKVLHGDADGESVSSYIFSFPTKSGIKSFSFEYSRPYGKILEVNKIN